MSCLEVRESGHIIRGATAYPTVVRLSDGKLVAAYSIGGGRKATGGTDWSYSVDNGQSWMRGGTILPPKKAPPTRNSLRLSLTPIGTLLAYGMEGDIPPEGVPFGYPVRRDPVFCVSVDSGSQWSPPKRIPTSAPGPWEITNPIVELSDGRWLAPAATLANPQRLGERVVAFVSHDFGKTWPESISVLEDPEGTRGFFETKLIELQAGVLLATAWTFELGTHTDFESHYSVSFDGGQAWSRPSTTGIRCQTITPLWLGGTRLLVLYNRRHFQPGVVAAIVTFTPEFRWEIETEHVVWLAREPVPQSDTQAHRRNIRELDSFAFGLPSAVRLDRHHFLAVHWCVEENQCGIRWTRIRLTLEDESR